MKGVFLIFRYFLTWQLLLRWFSAMGLVFLIAAPLIFILNYLDMNFRIFTFSIFNPFGIAFWAYLCLILFPFIATPLAFRNMISNPQLSLLPNFRLKAGLSLLVMTIILSLFPYLSLMPLIIGITGQTGSGAQVSLKLISLNIFCLASFYTLLFQLTLPSRFFIYLVSYGFFFIFILANSVDGLFITLMRDPVFVILFTLVCIIGWSIGLCILAKKKTFKPSDKVVGQKAFLAFPEATWLNKINVGHLKSSAGTLLTGIQDSLANKFKNAFAITIMSTLFSNLGLMFLLPVPACILIYMFSELTPVLIFHYFSAYIAYTLFITYLGLAARINNWPKTLLFILMILLLIGIMFFYFRLITGEQYELKLAIDLALIAVALCLRYLAKRGFLGIDWIVIKPEQFKRITIPG